MFTPVCCTDPPASLGHSRRQPRSPRSDTCSSTSTRGTRVVTARQIRTGTDKSPGRGAVPQPELCAGREQHAGEGERGSLLALAARCWAVIFHFPLRKCNPGKEFPLAVLCCCRRLNHVWLVASSQITETASPNK